jgi:hypothetical protein
MIAVDQAARQLRQIVAVSGMEAATESVRFAIAQDWAWPTAKPAAARSENRVKKANTSEPLKTYPVETYGL